MSWQVKGKRIRLTYHAEDRRRIRRIPMEHRVLGVRAGIGKGQLMTNPRISVSFDAEARAAYVRFSLAQVYETIEVAPDLLVDLDHQGGLVGVEILSAATLQLFLQRKLPGHLPPIPAPPPRTIRQLEEFFGGTAA